MRQHTRQPALGRVGPGGVTSVYRRLRTKEETSMTKSGSQDSTSASQLIDARIEALGDWRGEMLGRLRSLVKEACPDVVEEWKWRGVPVWSHNGMLCTGESYKSVVKVTFAKGASLPDPSGLFNSSLEGNHTACDRLPRRREDRRQGPQGPRSRRRHAERLQGQEVVGAHRATGLATQGAGLPLIEPAVLNQGRPICEIRDPEIRPRRSARRQYNRVLRSMPAFVRADAAPAWRPKSG